MIYNRIFQLILSLVFLSISTHIYAWDERKMYNLRGPVKTAEFPAHSITFPSGLVEFSLDGKCLTLAEREKDHSAIIIRDADGKIRKILNTQGGEMKFIYYYDTAKYNPGALISISNTDNQSLSTWSIDYNDEGNMVSQAIDFVSLADNNTQGLYITYQVLESDKYGNWTKRKVIARQKVGKEYSDETEERIEICKLSYFSNGSDISQFQKENLLKGDTYEEPTIIEEVSPQVDYNAIFTDPETKPEFPEGTAAIYRHIAKTMRYPLIAQENGKQGKVTVSFVIEKDGTLSDVKVTNGVDPNLDKEAIRVIKTLPNFTPGKMNGKPVRTSMSLPVTFKLN